jgi:hypothetical protein
MSENDSAVYFKGSPTHVFFEKARKLEWSQQQIDLVFPWFIKNVMLEEDKRTKEKNPSLFLLKGTEQQQFEIKQKLEEIFSFTQAETFQQKEEKNTSSFIATACSAIGNFLNLRSLLFSNRVREQ